MPLPRARWLVLCLLPLTWVTAGNRPSRAERSDALSSSPAEIVRQVHLSPAAGNGLQPVKAVLDAAHGRLFVLNNLSRNLSVVDVRRRRVAAVIQLPLYWDQLNERVEMAFDPRSDRVFIAATDMTQAHASKVVAISASLLRIVGVREIEDARISHLAVDPSRGLLFASAWYPTKPAWGIEALDAHSLETAVGFATRAEVTALAVLEKAGLLVTAEPGAPASPGGGPMGVLGYGSVEIVVHRMTDGAEVVRSAKLPRVLSLLPDEGRGHVIVCYDAQNLESAQQVGVLSLPNLKMLRARGFRDPTYRQERRLLDFGGPLLDSANKRLLVLFPRDGAIGVIGLREGITLNKGKPTAVAHLGAIDPATGQLFALGRESSVSALDLRRLHESWGLPLGAEISQIFLDRDRRRLLTLVNTDRSRLVWVRGERLSRLQDWNAERAWSILLVDFPRRWLYYTTPTIWGEGGYLHRTRLGGQEDRAFEQAMPGHLYVMALGEDPNRSYRAFAPPVGEWGKDTWVGVYQGPTEVSRIEVGRYPKKLIFVPTQGQLYLVYDEELRTLSGASTPLPRGVSLKPADQQRQVPPDRAVPVDIDASGRVAYYADPFDRVLYKLRLADGTVVASRRLEFAPTALALDEAAGVVYLVDWWGGRLVTVRAL